MTPRWLASQRMDASRGVRPRPAHPGGPLQRSLHWGWGRVMQRKRHAISAGVNGCHQRPGTPRLPPGDAWAPPPSRWPPWWPPRRPTPRRWRGQSPLCTSQSRWSGAGRGAAGEQVWDTHTATKRVYQKKRKPCHALGTLLSSGRAVGFRTLTQSDFGFFY